MKHPFAGILSKNGSKLDRAGCESTEPIGVSSRRRCLKLALQIGAGVVALGAVDAYAGPTSMAQGEEGGGGGGGGRGGRGRGGGGIRLRRKRPSKKRAPSFKKWSLPQATAVRELNKDCDLALKKLRLEKKQRAAIQKARKGILERINTLKKAQSEARSAYQSCKNDPVTATRCAVQVKSAAAACRSYDPNRAYRSAIVRQLSRQQADKFNKALAKR